MSERTGVTTVTPSPEAPGTSTDGAPVEPAPPAEAPAPPAGRRRRTRLRRWWARFLVLLMIVAAVLLGQRIIQMQDTRDATLDLGTVTLTSRAIPVETSVAGLVTAVELAPGQRVTAGRRVGEIMVTTTDAEGEPLLRRHSVTAPQDGIVVDEPVAVGSMLAPGQPFAELYDPNALQLVASVSAEKLPEISPGMRADLVAEGLDRHVRAVVTRAVPLVETDDDKALAKRFRLVLAPADPAQVADLIPGLRLTGSLDTRTAPEGSKESVYVR